MTKIAIVAALEREVGGLIRNCARIEREHEGRNFILFEHDEMVSVCGGIGMEAARRAAEAVIALYRPMLLQSVGFAGALDAGLRVGQVFSPAVVIDARDASRAEVEGGQGLLITFTAVADADQKANLAQTSGGQAGGMASAAAGAPRRARRVHFGAAQ